MQVRTDDHMRVEALPVLLLLLTTTKSVRRTAMNIHGSTEATINWFMITVMTLALVVRGDSKRADNEEKILVLILTMVVMVMNMKTTTIIIKLMEMNTMVVMVLRTLLIVVTRAVM